MPLDNCRRLLTSRPADPAIVSAIAQRLQGLPRQTPPAVAGAGHPDVLQPDPRLLHQCLPCGATAMPTRAISAKRTSGRLIC